MCDVAVLAVMDGFAVLVVGVFAAIVAFAAATAAARSRSKVSWISDRCCSENRGTPLPAPTPFPAVLEATCCSEPPLRRPNQFFHIVDFIGMVGGNIYGKK